MDADLPEQRPTGPARWGLAAAGLIAGGLVTIGALMLVGSSDDGAPAAVATSSTTTTEPPAAATPVWIDPRETIIGSTALIPTELDLDEGQLNLSYELFVIAPVLDPEVDGVPGLDEPERIFPRTWTVVTAAGEFPGSTSTIHARRARFEVPADTAVDDVLRIRLDSYLVPVPFSFPLEIDAGDSTEHQIGPGLAARIQTVIPQRENFLVIVEMVADDPFLMSDLIINGSGPEWVRASISQLGRPTWTLDYRGDELPDPIPLVAHGLLWVELEADATVDLEGIGS